MKKFLFLATMTGVTLAGCVNEEAPNVIQQAGEESVVRFDAPVVYSNASTKANVYSELPQEGKYPTGEDFVVYAVEHTGDFQGWDRGTIYMGTDADADDGLNTLNAGVKVKWNGKNAWEPENNNYHWPGGTEKLTFSAYSPADLEQGASWTGSVTYGKTGLNIENFTVNQNINKHFDLMYAKRAYNQTVNTTNGGYIGVPIVFQHALSSIRFQMQSDSKQTVTLTNLTIKNVFSTGDFHEGIFLDENNYSSYNSNPSWDNLEGSVNYIVVDNTTHTSGVRFNVTDATTGSLVGNKNFHNAIMLIPQGLGLNHGDVSTPKYPTLHVEWTVTEAGGETDRYSKDIPLFDLAYIPQTGVSSQAANSDMYKIKQWERGKRYIYHLHYGDDRILFAPSVQDWQDVSLIVIHLNEHVTTV